MPRDSVESLQPFLFWVTSSGEQRWQVSIDLICLPCKFTNAVLWVDTMSSGQLSSSIRLHISSRNAMHPSVFKGEALIKLPPFLGCLDWHMPTYNLQYTFYTFYGHTKISSIIYVPCIIISAIITSRRNYLPLLLVSIYIDSCRLAFIWGYQCYQQAIFNCAQFNKFRRQINLKPHNAWKTLT